MLRTRPCPTPACEAPPAAPVEPACENIMAPGYCSCGGVYSHHSCNNPRCTEPTGPVRRSRLVDDEAERAAVSYTHLTLPTICSV
eukprot:739222-Alexandrium_andersonii.AAC.1